MGQKKNFAGALEIWKKVVTLIPDCLDAHVQCGLAFAKTGQNAEAERELKSALKCSGNPSLAMFNLSAIYIREKKFTDCVDICKQAKKYEPSAWSDSIHTNMSVALSELNQNTEAIEENKRVLSHDPSDSKTLRNLALDYEKTGQLELAKKTWADYLTAHPDGEFSTLAKDDIKMLNSLGQMNDPKDADYASKAITNKVERWVLDRPLKVYINVASASESNKPGWPMLCLDAFDAWTKASGKVKWDDCETPKDADIVCQWVDQLPPDELRKNELGLTLVKYCDHDPRNIKQALILILKKDKRISISDKRMKAICLHEVGHALGIRGHSANPADIMYFASVNESIAELSARDKATIASLYGGN